MFFTGRMPFLQPNQQRQSTEGKPSAKQDSVYRILQWERAKSYRGVSNEPVLSRSTRGQTDTQMQTKAPPTLADMQALVIFSDTLHTHVLNSTGMKGKREREWTAGNFYPFPQESGGEPRNRGQGVIFMGFWGVFFIVSFSDGRLTGMASSLQKTG